MKMMMMPMSGKGEPGGMKFSKIPPLCRVECEIFLITISMNRKHFLKGFYLCMKLWCTIKKEDIYISFQLSFQCKHEPRGGGDVCVLCMYVCASIPTSSRLRIGYERQMLFSLLFFFFFAFHFAVLLF
jgi:hypothetical protein